MMTADDRLHGSGTTVPRILCVDDNDLCRKLYDIALRRMQCDPEFAHDGAQAYDMIRLDPGRFQLVITDHEMPVMSGLALVTSLRLLAFPGRICVASSVVEGWLQARYEALAVDAFLPKPFRMEAFRRVIEGLLSRNPQDPNHCIGSVSREGTGMHT